MTGAILALLLAAEGFLVVPPIVPTVQAPEPVVRLSEGVTMEVTFFTCSEAEGTADCWTASGTPAREGIAAHRTLPFGTLVEVQDLGRFVIEDRGGGLGSRHLDIYVDSVEEAFRLGRMRKLVWVVQE